MANSLREKLRNLREKKGYSLDKLAEITDTSKSYLWELENRETRKPSADKLIKIADALGVTIDYLMDDSTEPDQAVVKEAFFRKYSKLDPADQKKINEIVDMWSKK